MTTRKIKQIIPAQPGWRAVYRSNHGFAETLPVACFALIETTEEGQRRDKVEAMVATGGMIDSAEHACPNYFMVASPDLEQAELNEEAAKWYSGW
jgi:hypothetical protein